MTEEGTTVLAETVGSVMEELSMLPEKLLSSFDGLLRKSAN